MQTWNYQSQHPIIKAQNFKPASLHLQLSEETLPAVIFLIVENPKELAKSRMWSDQSNMRLQSELYKPTMNNISWPMGRTDQLPIEAHLFLRAHIRKWDIKAGGSRNESQLSYSFIWLIIQLISLVWIELILNWNELEA